jgi:hypothetical protein
MIRSLIRWQHSFVPLATMMMMGLVSLRLHAQIPEAVYSDAKDVIEELITVELSEAAVPGIACYSGRQVTTLSDPD